MSFRAYIFLLLLTSTGMESFSFSNPIIDGYSAGPCIYKLGDFYYLTLVDLNRTELVIHKSLLLTNFRNAEKNVALRVPDGFIDAIPNEMLEIDGDLYLYFHMGIPSALRLYAIKANYPLEPLGGWGVPIRLLNDWEYSVNDGTVMKHNNQLYFVWTNRSTEFSLFIAPMTSPTWVGNPKTLLKKPNEPWECQDFCVAEGATFLYSNNVSYLIYSVSVGRYPDHSLAQMSISEGTDPLISGNWKMINEPVFRSNDEEDVFGPGRAEFTVSPDGTETWMIHQASVNPINVHLRQTARIQKIEWNEDGSPKFPRPIGYLQTRPVPSGQILVCVYRVAINAPCAVSFLITLYATYIM